MFWRRCCPLDRASVSLFVTFRIERDNLMSKNSKLFTALSIGVEKDEGFLDKKSTIQGKLNIQLGGIRK
jgi:hypothetical protein